MADCRTACYCCFSIDQLCEVMRHAIESGEKILQELCLQNTEFIVNEVCKFLKQ